MNQFLINAHALNFGKLDQVFSNKNNFHNKNNNIFKNLLVDNINNGDSILTKEDINDLEKFVDDTFDQTNFDNFNNTKNSPIINNNSSLIKKEIKNQDIKDKKAKKKEKTMNIKSKKEEEITSTNFKQVVKTSLPLPSRSIISSSQFKVPSRGYVNLKGPNVTLNLKSADPIEALKLIGDLGNYGIVIITDDDKENKTSQQTKITAIFNGTNISDAFNSILLSANLQAIIEKNIIFVGKNILSKSLES